MIGGLVVIALFLMVISAINALGVYMAAYFVKAATNGYGISFVIIFKGYLLFLLMIIVAALFSIHSMLYVGIVILAIPCWVIYQLVDQLAISGKINVIIFVVVSFVLNVVLFAVLHALQIIQIYH